MTVVVSKNGLRLSVNASKSTEHPDAWKKRKYKSQAAHWSLVPQNQILARHRKLPMGSFFKTTSLSLFFLALSALQTPLLLYTEAAPVSVSTPFDEAVRGE